MTGDRLHSMPAAGGLSADRHRWCTVRMAAGFQAAMTRYDVAFVP